MVVTALYVSSTSCPYRTMYCKHQKEVWRIMALYLDINCANEFGAFHCLHSVNEKQLQTQQCILHAYLTLILFHNNIQIDIILHCINTVLYLDISN